MNSQHMSSQQSRSVAFEHLSCDCMLSPMQQPGSAVGSEQSASSPALHSHLLLRSHEAGSFFAHSSTVGEYESLALAQQPASTVVSCGSHTASSPNTK